MYLNFYCCVPVSGVKKNLCFCHLKFGSKYANTVVKVGLKGQTTPTVGDVTVYFYDSFFLIHLLNHLNQLTLNANLHLTVAFTFVLAFPSRDQDLNLDCFTRAKSRH